MIDRNLVCIGPNDPKQTFTHDSSPKKNIKFYKTKRNETIYTLLFTMSNLKNAGMCNDEG